jgi:hypothetical protein
MIDRHRATAIWASHRPMQQARVTLTSLGWMLFGLIVGALAKGS